MLKPPKVLGLTLCRRMDIDRASAEVSLLGIFHYLYVPKFPAAEPFLAYAALYGGSGEGKIELGVRRTETETDIYKYERWTGFPGHGLTTHLELPIRRCVFPAPGRYLLTLRLEKLELAQRYLDVLKRRRPR